MEQGDAWSRHAFVLTDIEASTKRWEADTESMSADLAHHDEVVQSVLGGAGGSLVNPTGDGFLPGWGAPLSSEEPHDGGDHQAFGPWRPRAVVGLETDPLRVLRAAES